MAQLDALPVQSSQIMAVTRTDALLSKVLAYSRKGWSDQVPEALRPFQLRREEITVEGDCILWGTRVIVPAKLRLQVLQELQRGHPGVVCMKSLAPSHVWWPGIDRDIEDCAKKCTSSQENKASPPKAPLYP